MKKNKKQQRLAVFQPEFIEDLRYWVDNDRRTALRIFDLLEAIMRDPFQGIGKPEPLKETLSGFWSRRIDTVNRLVYTIDESTITIISCRYHYES